MSEAESEPTTPGEEHPDRVSRLKEPIRAARARALQARSRLEEYRSSSAAVDQALSTLELDTEAGGGVLAAALAFRIFLLAVPFVFFVTVAFGFADTLSGQSPAAVARRLGVGGLIVQAVASASQLSGFTRVVTLLTALVATFITGRSLLRTLRIVHGLVWRVKVAKQRHPALAVLILLGIVAAGLVLGMTVDRLEQISVLGKVAGVVILVVVPTTAWVFISAALPHAPDTTWRDYLPGSLLFGVATVLLHVFTVVWIARSVEHKSQTYGSIGAVLALLLWTYVLGRIITAAAAFNRSSHRRFHPPV